jgi:mannose-1-phosphate guanylyltransferase/mannose-6-phosphate isomerase
LQRNTAPAITLGALEFLDRELLLVMPADHEVPDVIGFRESVLAAKNLAEQEKLVTFGVKPTSPNTGFGYIEAGSPILDGFEVSSFVEKPSLSVAEKFLEDGGYFWNSGIFLFSPILFLSELQRFRPAILEVSKLTYQTGYIDLAFKKFDRDTFADSVNESVDYAVFQQSTSVCVLPLASSWSDLGSWENVNETLQADNDNNVVKGDVLPIKSKNSLVFSTSRLTVAFGLEDVAVVETKDAVFVAPISETSKIKEVCEKLAVDERLELLEKPEMFRPWGKYESLSEQEGYKVKLLTVAPGSQLSLQKHINRAEHWVVISGTAEVTVGEDLLVLQPNESTFIPINTKHRLKNPGTEPLRVIEVQTGDYLGEDDIVRFEDVYGRAH